METFYSYLKSALYNIRKNKVYTIFSIAGAALTFVFITIVVQLYSDTVRDVPPFVNAGKEIHLNAFVNTRGKSIGGIRPMDIPLILNGINGYEACAMYNLQYDNIFVNHLMSPGLAGFVNEDFWKINKFDFIHGRGFSPKDIADKKRVAVIRKTFARKNFKTGKILGEKVTFQNIEYTVIGIIDDYSVMASPSNLEEDLLLPYCFNKFYPDMTPWYQLYIVPKKGSSVSALKEETVRSLKDYYKNRNEEVDINEKKILTVKEERVESFGQGMLSYGVPVALFVLLVIPALNILLLNTANVNIRSREIAIRRVMGANVFSSFLQIILESFILVLAGSVTGVILSAPVANFISRFFFNNGVGDVCLISKIWLPNLVLVILPLVLVFTLLSGGIPAYIVSKKDITESLKGGTK